MNSSSGEWKTSSGRWNSFSGGLNTFSGGWNSSSGGRNMSSGGWTVSSSGWNASSGACTASSWGWWRAGPCNLAKHWAQDCTQGATSQITTLTKQKPFRGDSPGEESRIIPKHRDGNDSSMQLHSGCAHWPPLPLSKQHRTFQTHNHRPGAETP